ncbi:MAG TPA: hypothetical protein VN203_22980, partial [Candidatus Acidoferrum sp.]|nr:hypothetical protein [Candidatus Acidoferrum sp.]
MAFEGHGVFRRNLPCIRGHFPDWHTIYKIGHFVRRERGKSAERARRHWGFCGPPGFRYDYTCG